MSNQPPYDDIDFINLNDIKTNADVIDAADYHVKIVDIDVRQNKAKDGYYMNYRLVIQSGEHAGFSFYSTWPLKEKARWRMKKDFDAMGYSPPGGVPHKADLLGFEGIARVKVEESEGYPPKNTIARWLGPLA